MSQYLWMNPSVAENIKWNVLVRETNNELFHDIEDDNNENPAAVLLNVHELQSSSGCAIMRTGHGPVGISYRAKLPRKKNILLPSIRTRPHKYVRRISK